MESFRELAIKDTWYQSTVRHTDSRGWLVETYREDRLADAGLGAAVPVMSYVSLTLPGVARGPHEHREQTDYFAFLGPSTFRVYLWDNRSGSPTFGRKVVLDAGEDSPGLLIVPPGVVHAYQNVGGKDGLVLNFPNRLFAGRGKTEPVDEIRHEDDPASRFKLEG